MSQMCISLHVLSSGSASVASSKFSFLFFFFFFFWCRFKVASTLRSSATRCLRGSYIFCPSSIEVILGLILRNFLVISLISRRYLQDWLPLVFSLFTRALCIILSTVRLRFQSLRTRVECVELCDRFSTSVAEWKGQSSRLGYFSV